MPTATDAAAPVPRPHKDDIDFIAALITFSALHDVVLDNEHEIHTESPVFSLAKRVVRRENGALSLDELESGEEETLYTAAASIDPPEAPKARRIVEERVLQFMVNGWKERLTLLLQQERRAQQDQDRVRSAELFDQILELKKRIESPELNRDDASEV